MQRAQLLGRRQRRWLCAAVLLAAVGGLHAPTSAADLPVQFNRDIRPLLSDNCFQCHGPDAAQRQADLRLDRAESATAPRDGQRAIAPGAPEQSTLLARLTATDPAERMPPAETGRRLSDEQVALLRRWIAEGAAYEPHWSLIPPGRPEPPPLDDAAWVRNPIDRFVLARLRRAGLAPSSEASRETLLRRVTLDLTGVPPTAAEIDAFLLDNRPQAFEAVVDRLLASPRFGERMAQDWLDAARYADTNGYNNDTPRFMWRWRDWVIDAFNRNLPFDQFATQQLAGDLLPDATLDQKLATGFCRNHVINSEGGIIDEEYRLEYVADRMQTVATVFLGLTIGCARCHDHKFDPLTQRDYYRMFAFFNNVPETGYAGRYGNSPPMMPAPTAEQAAAQAAIAAERNSLETAIAAQRETAHREASAWEARLGADLIRGSEPPADVLAHFPFDEEAGAEALDAARAEARGKIVGAAERGEGRFGRGLRCDGQTHVELADTANFDRDSHFTFSAWVRTSRQEPQAVLARMDDAPTLRGYDLLLEQGKLTAHLINHWPDNAVKVQAKTALSPDAWHLVAVTYDGSSRAVGVKLYVDGLPQEVTAHNDSLSAPIKTGRPLRLGRRGDQLAFHGQLDDVRIYARDLSAAEVGRLAHPGAVRQILALPRESRTPEQQQELEQHYLDQFDEEFGRLRAALAQLGAREGELTKAIVNTMVMQELPERRKTFVLARGQYDQPGEEVAPGVPASLPLLPAGAPPDRRGFAQWLVDPGHPLTARVAVNRFWQMAFGLGLVETLEDFGSQGGWPSHPELLDWLATEFSGHGWDTKALLKLVVTSATYRQSSRVTPELSARDPQNRLLARGPRFRLSAETIRDSALFAGGLLHERIGGPSVKPYQPPGLWEDVIVSDDSYSGGAYQQDHGESLYRRSLYTHWKRTCPPPSLNTFDAPEREFCTVRRSQTNTPLQALVLLNDPTYVESARGLAQRMMLEAPTDAATRVAHGFRLAASRRPTAAETATLLGVYERRLAQFRADVDTARRLLVVGESKADERLDPCELAAWTVVANMLLNLDEIITRG